MGMGLKTAQVQPWSKNRPFSQHAAIRQLADEGLTPYPWSNGPNDYYPVHEHTYDKVIYVLSGSITFGLPTENRRLSLETGDRLDLPAGLQHDAVVGPAGVSCLEAHRPAGQP